ncbi:16S rRNA (cytosine(967)-C(5))-methyltransferase RsmB [Marinimicrobium sp. C6131]|uniref:16S rRNA (cytosine(967)-C(5))-methyltransferase RsmB n=1 Tax=Marinimicrobium sp. C6131 TaxID=3022676 RepID=UPI00223CB95A|nr:16S rRNA (cytosine(967)-C(5))-methyltransferase RsmB [Marinimicrobium sp. C6131]UZJ43779.1 16S rRNA (cytosine(967)-C(5))-methyltransferase RsmB [Marinimicrobium sp. C6131]
MKVRTAAAKLLADLLRQQGSLASLLPDYQSRVPERDAPLLQELTYGTCRWYPRLNAYLGQLLDKPLKPKDGDIQALLLLGLYQQLYTRIPDHAAIGATVESTRELKKPWAKGLVNGVLRRFQREQEALDTALADDDRFTTAHPDWLLKRLRHHWPEQTDAIIAANNGHPPLTLRVNPAYAAREDYLAQLRDQDIEASLTPFSPVGITLQTPCQVTALPGFEIGGVSVQDEAAQFSAELLELRPGQRVLDACSAPGGKTGHILETEPGLSEVVALDSDARRLGRVQENLDRLRKQATLRCGDAGQPDHWWDGTAFDRILLDAPCSATGIIRRQPDIKVLRSAADIDRLSALQGRLLSALWSTLKPGGVLVYATCSILPEENTRVVEAFVRQHPDAQCETLEVDWGLEQPCGRQLLPRDNGHDGFYYARLHKIGKKNDRV